ncbi:MAG: DUF1304 domain-containing protein [Planctomycetes bacterium]|nr:DUF1304 domain-containing protein [Planctomycetota bacterium]
MMTFSAILVAIVALLHLWFLILEMFLWDKPLGLRIFGQSKEQARATKLLAMNQGLYNGFLAAGLIWGLLLHTDGAAVQIFFLSCVIIAGFFGGYTVNKRIISVQAVPAAIALLAVII